MTDIDARILSDVDSGKFNLDMSDYHCGTSYCMAGFADLYAKKLSADMSGYLGYYLTGALIFKKSTGRIPNFFASDKAAMADMRAHA